MSKNKFPTMSELIDRPENNPNYSTGWQSKLTEDEMDLWEEITRKQLIDEGVPDKFPEINSALLTKVIDNEILYNLFLEARKNVHRKKESKYIFNKIRKS